MQDNWISSYNNKKHRRMLFPDKPSGAGKMLLEYVDEQEGIERSSLSVLDIGCGNGRNSVALAKEGFKYITGFDIIPQAIEDAQIKTKNEGSDVCPVDFFVHNINEEWPIEDDAFDIAFDVNTYSSLNISERLMYMKELRRVLRDDGIFFLTTYTIHDSYYNQFVKRNSKIANPGAIVFCPDDEIERILYTPEELTSIFSEAFIPKKEKIHAWYGKMFDIYYKRQFVSIIFHKNNSLHNVS